MSDGPYQEVKKDPNLGKESVHKPIKDTTEDFVAHKDGEVEVPDNHGARVFNRIWEVTGCGETKPNHVQSESQAKEFTMKQC